MDGQKASGVSEIERVDANRPDGARDAHEFHTFGILKGALSDRFQTFRQVQFRKGTAI